MNSGKTVEHIILQQGSTIATGIEIMEPVQGCISQARILEVYLRYPG
jgi:hypothetical protein